MPQQNPYDYILNPAKPQKKPFLFGGGKPNKLVMALFVLGVLLLVVIAYSAFVSLTSKSYDAVVGLAQRQEEIIRIADLGLSDANDPSTLTYVSTIRNITLSEQQDTLAFLNKKDVKINEKQLALKKDTSTDKALEAAVQNNTYDQVLLSKLNNELSAYQKAQKNVDGINDTKSEKALFATLSSNAKIIANE
jgi:hypothetical protein